MKFYRFPTCPDLRRRWIVSLNRKNWNFLGFAVSILFQEILFVRSIQMKLCMNVGEKSNDSMHPNYLPSVFSFSKQSALDKKSQLDKYTRSKVRGKKRCRENSKSENEVPVHADENTTVIETAVHDTAADFEGVTFSNRYPPCTTCIDLRSQLEMEHQTTKAKQMDAYNQLEEECRH